MMSFCLQKFLKLSFREDRQRYKDLSRTNEQEIVSIIDGPMTDKEHRAIR